MGAARGMSPRNVDRLRALKIGSTAGGIGQLYTYLTLSKGGKTIVEVQVNNERSFESYLVLQGMSSQKALP